MAVVNLNNVQKYYPASGIKAVTDFNMEIKDGEFVALVGPSGCGKSTTLRMVAGLEDITEGEVKIDGKVVNNLAPKNRDIAMVFQSYALYPHMTVYDNMAFGLKLRRYSKEEIRKRVYEAADILGIRELVDRRPKQLSGGQRQRVAVGRAIVRQPKVFLFDEPLSNLDAKMRVQMRVEISQLHSRLQTTMIYVTHDQVEAMTMGDRIVVMRDGFIQQIDSPTQLYDFPANKYVASFIGTPPMNFFEGRIEAEGESMEFKSESFTVSIPAHWQDDLREYTGKAITFGIRPEDLRLKGGEGSTGDAPLIPAKIDLVEPMGSETYLYLTTGETSFIARVESHTKCKIDDQLELEVDMNKAHFFNQETEEAVSIQQRNQ